MSAPFPRDAYEGAGGWTDGRFGQAYDLIEAALKERGVDTFRLPLLAEIEALDVRNTCTCGACLECDAADYHADLAKAQVSA